MIMAHVMTHEFPQNKSLFDCVDLIKPLKCFACANFETHCLSDLKHHIKAGHTLPEKSQERLHQCGGCNFETYSKLLFSRHQLLDVCMSGRKLTSEAGLAEVGTDRQPENDLDFIDYSSLPKLAQCVLHDHSYVRTMHKFDHQEQSHDCWLGAYTNTNTGIFTDHILITQTNPNLVEWYACEHCSYETPRSRNLKRHVRYNHGQKESIKCNQCPFETKFSSSLKYHILAKHTDRDKIHWFQCDQCPFKCRRKGHLKSHTDYKHGVKKYLQCGYCSHETKSKRNLRNHIISKHTAPEGIQWLRCAQCAFKSKTKGNLKKHVDSKHGSKESLKCDHCRFETKFTHSLKRHVLTQHIELEQLGKFEFSICY